MRQIVAFSGGKDSTALALAFPKAQPVFTDTKWEHPELYQHIERFEQVTGRNVERVVHPDWPGGIPEYIRATKFFPNHGARYCTRIFKIDALNLWLESSGLLVDGVELLIALRADEPEDERIGNLSNLEGLTIRYPFREKGVNVDGVLKICLDCGLLPRYPPYMARGGCMGCFYKRKAQVYSMVHLAPDQADILQELEESVQDVRKKYFYMFSNVGMSIADVKKQQLLFSPEEVYSEIATDQLGPSCGVFCRR